MASSYGDHTSIDAVPTTRPNPMAFQKYLKKIHDGLTKKDMDRLRFLCRDLISTQDLEGITRGLVLFTNFKKRLLIGPDDVCFLIELLQAISRKDLVKIACAWPGASAGIQRQPKISRFRLLLYNLAINSTSKELEDMKLMTMGGMGVCMEDDVDSFQFFIALEKQDVISPENVSQLHDILPNEEAIEKVRKYERPVVSPSNFSQPNTASSTCPQQDANSAVHYAANNTRQYQQSQNPSLFPLATTIQFQNSYLHQGANTATQYAANNTGQQQQSQNPPGFPMATQAASTTQSQNPSTYSHQGANITRYAAINTRLQQSHTPPGFPMAAPNAATTQSHDPPGFLMPAQAATTARSHPFTHPHVNSTTHAPMDSRQQQSHTPPGFPMAAPIAATMQSHNPPGFLMTAQTATTTTQSQNSLTHPPQGANSATHYVALGSSQQQQSQDSSRFLTSAQTATRAQSQNPLGFQTSTYAPYQPETGLVNQLEGLKLNPYKESVDKQALSFASLAALLASIDTFPTNTGQNTRDPQDMNVPQNIEQLLHFDNQDMDHSFLNFGPWDFTPKAGMPRYLMTHDPRGLCLIINNMQFEGELNLKERKGSDVDTGHLLKLFFNLKFHVRCKNNLSAVQMYDQLDELRRMDHQDYDCFVCCILSHGQEGAVYGSDEKLNKIQDLTGLFTGIKCPTLAGKPKLFFIQACQGTAIQVGVKGCERDGPTDPSGLMIPTDDDFLIGYSTPPGYASFRSITKGTWYICSLVQYIELNHNNVDLLNLLAQVNEHVGKCSTKEGYKQSAPYISYLTKALFL